MKAICRRRFVLIAAVSAGSFIAFGAAAQMPKNPQVAKAAEASWKGAKIYVPAELTASGKPCDGALGSACETSIKEGKHPVIVFMHGCDGPRVPATFMGRGAIVVALVSSGGANTCNTPPQEFGRLILQRRADALVASTSLKEKPWANPAKLVLAGYSQGARVAALYQRGDYIARIIIGWTCTSPRNAEQSGIRGTEPTLAVLGGNDTYLASMGITGNCNAAIAERGASSKSVVIPGGQHDILDHPVTRKAVADFLAEVLK